MRLAQFFSLCFFILNGCTGYQNYWDNRIPQDIMVDVINKLGLKLLAKHNENNHNNIALSPYGAIGALAALREGTQGEAAFEIDHAINLPSNIKLVRVGLRDVHRLLRSFFIPEEGFLSGLTLSHDNVPLNREYVDILKFYGYDVDLFNRTLFPSKTTELSDSSTTDSSTTDPSTSTIMEERESTLEITTVSSESTPIATTTTTTTIPTTSELVSTTIAATPGTTIVTTTENSMTETTEVRRETTEGIQRESTGTEISMASDPTEESEVEIIDTSSEENRRSTRAEPTTTVPPTESTISSESPQNEIMTTTSLAPDEENRRVTTENQVREDAFTDSSEQSTLAASTETTEQTTTTETQELTSTIITTTTTESSTNTAEDEVTENMSTSTISDLTTLMESTEISTSTSTEDTNSPNNRMPRSVVDYVIARYLDDHITTYRPPPIQPEHLTFLVNGDFHERNINFMIYDTILPFAYIPHLEALALRFPLDSSRYYLLLVLPVQGVGIDELICKMGSEGDLSYIIKNLRYTHVKAIIPSFNLKGSVVLTPSLQKLGIKKVFEPRQADFSPMTTVDDIYVTNIEQALTVKIKNYIDPTTINNNLRYLQRYEPILFKADHPFLYFIIDSDIHVTLMAGKIINPLNTRIR